MQKTKNISELRKVLQLLDAINRVYALRESYQNEMLIN
jgi:hypothetical protein